MEAENAESSYVSTVLFGLCREQTSTATIDRQGDALFRAGRRRGERVYRGGLDGCRAI
jgi:hypothetical protein